MIRHLTPRTTALRHAAQATVVLLLAIGVARAATYEPPRTPSGAPDLQGVWSNASITTLERHPRYSSLVLSEQEVQAATDSHPQVVRQRTDDHLGGSTTFDGSDLKSGRGYNAFWIDPGMSFGLVKGRRRTSWIVEPADGRIPYSERGAAARAALARKHASYDGPETRPPPERCLVIGGRAGPPIVNGLYNNNYQIVQTEDHVVILSEMVSHARIVRLNGAHTHAKAPQLFGDAVGWWEGDTLVVENTNFHALQADSPVPLTQHGKVIERFTRVSDAQILYEFTVEDAFFYERPWRGEMSLNRSAGPIYEYACHEGNYALTGILAGAREQERAAGGAPHSSKGRAGAPTAP